MAIFGRNVVMLKSFWSNLNFPFAGTVKDKKDLLGPSLEYGHINCAAVF
jgi:hypothetical protein